MPPPKHAVYYVYEAQVDLGMQFTPFDTHLIPEIAAEHKVLVVNIESVQAFSLQLLNVLSQKQTPSVPYTQPA